MNNIHEDDWAADNWGGHTGMSNDSDYSKIDEDECKPEAENKRKEGGTQVQKQDNKD